MRRVEYMKRQRGMKKRKSFFGRRRVQILLTLGVLLLATAVVIGSGAFWTSTSANPGNVFTAGNLTHDNDGTVLTLSDLKPDGVWVEAGSIGLQNTGSVAADFFLSTSGLSNTPGANGGNLSAVLQLRVWDVDNTTYVYNGPINSVGTVSLGPWSAGDTQTYRFDVMFPDGGLPGGATTGDNAYQDSSMEITFNWEGVST